MSEECLSTPAMTVHPGRTFEECFRRYLDEQIDTDVSFIVGEDKVEVKAHKMVLKCRSPVFSRMLSETFHDGGNIEIKDASPESFKTFLGFLYTDQVDINEDNAISLLHLSDKYDLPLLFDECIEFLNDNIKVDNACLIFAAAKRHNSERLKLTALSFICINTESLKSEEFLNLSGKDIIDISGNENLSCKEEYLLDSLCKWAEARCKHRGDELNDVNKRQVLGDLLFTVRFPLMEYKYLMNTLSKGQLLTDSELKLVLQIQSEEYYDTENSNEYSEELPEEGDSDDSLRLESNSVDPEVVHVSSEEDYKAVDSDADDFTSDYTDKEVADTSKQESHLLFNGKARKAMQPENVIFETGFITLSTDLIQEEQILLFSVSTDSWLYGIILYGPEIETRFGYELSVCSNSYDPSVIAKTSSFITSDENSYTCNIPLDAPILLKESRLFKCSIMVFSKPSCRFYRRSETKSHIDARKIISRHPENIGIFHTDSSVALKMETIELYQDNVVIEKMFRHKVLNITERSNQIVGLMLF